MVQEVDLVLGPVHTPEQAHVHAPCLRAMAKAEQVVCGQGGPAALLDGLGRGVFPLLDSGQKVVQVPEQEGLGEKGIEAQGTQVLVFGGGN